MLGDSLVDGARSTAPQRTRENVKAIVRFFSLSDFAHLCFTPQVKSASEGSRGRSRSPHLSGQTQGQQSRQAVWDGALGPGRSQLSVVGKERAGCSQINVPMQQPTWHPTDTRMRKDRGECPVMLPRSLSWENQVGSNGIKRKEGGRTCGSHSRPMASASHWQLT